MVQSRSWITDWLAASQEIPHISRNPKVHYSTHKRTPPIPLLGQPNPVHMPTSHLLEIHPNIIHPSTPRSPQWSLSLRFPHQDPIHSPLLTHTRHIPSPSQTLRNRISRSRRGCEHSLCLRNRQTIRKMFIPLNPPPPKKRLAMITFWFLLNTSLPSIYVRYWIGWIEDPGRICNFFDTAVWRVVARRFSGISWDRVLKPFSMLTARKV